MWDLIRRLNAGETSDDLAHDIATTLAGPRPYMREDDPWQWTAWHKAEHSVKRAFRGSVDAVLALMPDGWVWGLDGAWREDIPNQPDGWSWTDPCDTDQPRALCGAYVGNNGIVIGEVQRMPTPAIALLAALLEGVARSKGITG